MEIKQLTKEGLRVIYEIRFAKNDLENIRKTKLEALSKKVSMDGFRVGKVPLDRIESKYGNTVMQEVLEEATDMGIRKLYKDENLMPVSSPKVQVNEFSVDGGLTVSVEVELFPEIKDIKYSSIVLNKKSIDIEDKDLEESLDKMANYYKSFEDIAEIRAVRNGDVALIDFTGKIDGVLFDGGSGKDFPLEIGSNMFIPGFEEQLVGKEVGEKIDVKVPFPKDYHAKHLAGKDTIFEVVIKKIQQVVKHPIGDELAKKGGFDNLALLKEDIRAKYQEQLGAIENNSLKKQLIDKLYEVEDFELPVSLLEAEKNALWEEFLHFKDHMKSHESKEDFVEHGHNQEDIKSYRRPEAEVKIEHEQTAKKRIKLALLLSSIGSKNSIVVEDKDIYSVIDREAKMYSQDPSKLLSHYKNNKDAMKTLQNRALEDKILLFILSKVNYNEVKMTFEEYTGNLGK